MSKAAVAAPLIVLGGIGFIWFLANVPDPRLLGMIGVLFLVAFGFLIVSRIVYLALPLKWRYSRTDLYAEYRRGILDAKASTWDREEGVYRFSFESEQPYARAFHRFRERHWPVSIPPKVPSPVINIPG